ncbi:MAG: hypothetical protein U0271_24540 [Polyangiaceae bacterium]
MERYLRLLADIPLPTDEQTRWFANYVRGAHDWHKHLSPYPPGSPFVFWLDPFKHPIERYGRVGGDTDVELGGHWTYWADPDKPIVVTDPATQERTAVPEDILAVSRRFLTPFVSRRSYCASDRFHGSYVHDRAVEFLRRALANPANLELQRYFALLAPCAGLACRELEIQRPPYAERELIEDEMQRQNEKLLDGLFATRAALSESCRKQS